MPTLVDIFVVLASNLLCNSDTTSRPRGFHKHVALLITMQAKKVDQNQQVETVKQLIRQNHYKNYEYVLQLCIAKGIKVNRPALDNFAKRLARSDKEEKQTQTTLFGDDIGFSADPDQQVLSFSQVTNRDDALRRQQQIAYELGALKIKEHELLQELQALKVKFGC